MPPKSSVEEQQKAFDEFLKEFNEERPHEALNMQTPQERYVRSERQFPRRLKEMEYGSGYRVRRVRSNGEIRWDAGLLYLSQALIGERVGLKETDNDQWAIYFGPWALATFDSRQKRLQPVKLGL